MVYTEVYEEGWSTQGSMRGVVYTGIYEALSTKCPWQRTLHGGEEEVESLRHHHVVVDV